ncbi:hypothetical protein [Leptothoe spongobia]|nr:hypothetical protein [Leptothoe spongobia]
MRQAPDCPSSLAEPAKMAELWARKYLGSLEARSQSWANGFEVKPRIVIARRLVSELRTASAKAWHLTESLLAYEVQRHGINATLIDPWKVSKDVHTVYVKALAAYGKEISPQRLSVKISGALGKLRQRYTAVDPRLIGFVSMQFHYCGKILVDSAPSIERKILMSYFKVIDDHLYMPLQRAYNAAAHYSYGDERLTVIQTLLPHITTIAKNVVTRVNQLYPNYCSYTDRLNNPLVQISSIRDAEMFQVYLWTCVLEQRFDSIQEELFPLCVMLYPTLKVNWELVRQMLHLLAREFKDYVTHNQMLFYAPYQDALWEMFSPNIFPDIIELD